MWQPQWKSARKSALSDIQTLNSLHYGVLQRERERERESMYCRNCRNCSMANSKKTAAPLASRRKKSKSIRQKCKQKAAIINYNSIQGDRTIDERKNNRTVARADNLSTGVRLTMGRVMARRIFGEFRLFIINGRGAQQSNGIGRRYIGKRWRIKSRFDPEKRLRETARIR